MATWSAMLQKVARGGQLVGTVPRRAAKFGAGQHN